MPEDYWQMGSGPEQEAAVQDPGEIYDDYIYMRGAYAADRSADGAEPSTDTKRQRLAEFPEKMPDVYAAYKLDAIGHAVRVRLNGRGESPEPLTEWTGARAGEGLRLMRESGHRTLSVEHPSRQLLRALGDLSQSRSKGDRIVITFGKSDKSSGDERPVATCTFVSRSDPADVLVQPMPTERLVDLLRTGMFETPLTRMQRIGRMAIDASPLQRLTYRTTVQSLRPENRRR